MHSVVCSTASVYMLKQTKRLKWFLNYSFCYRKVNAIESINVSHKIICTDSRLQRALNLEAQSQHVAEINSENTCFPVMLVKDGCKLVDHRYFKPIPTETLSLQDFMLTEEFKNILAKSSFSYNVDLNGSLSNDLKTSGRYMYSFQEIYCNTMNSCEKKEIDCDLGKVLMGDKSKVTETGDTSKPTEEQLRLVMDRLTQILLNFFEKPHDFSIYHQNIVFQNNIKGVIIKGRPAYIQAMFLLKVYGRVTFANVKVEILKATTHIEDGTTRVRWRVKGVRHHRALLFVWRLRRRGSSWKDFCEERSEWLDGFSVFSVGADGLIYKHVCDKMTPSDDPSPSPLKSRLLRLLQLPGGRSNPSGALLPCSQGKKML